MICGQEKGPKLVFSYNCHGCMYLDEMVDEVVAAPPDYHCVHPESPAGREGSRIVRDQALGAYCIPTPKWCPYPRSRVS